MVRRSDGEERLPTKNGVDVSPALTPSVSVNPPAPSQLPDPIATRQQVFTIPFTVNPREAPPREVRLYVSADDGKTWQFYQRQTPDAGGFHFRAAEDGDYCFAVWTVKNGAPAAVSSPLRAELRVVVDTVLPELDFTADLGHGGEIRGRWTASDAHLAPNPLKIEYRTGGSAWKGVALPPPAGAPSLQVQGEVSWWAEPASDGIVEVRAILEDQAGNIRQIVHRVAVAQRLPAQSDVRPSENTDGTRTDSQLRSVQESFPTVPPADHDAGLDSGKNSLVGQLDGIPESKPWQASPADKPLSPHVAGGWTAAGGPVATPLTSESNRLSSDVVTPKDGLDGTVTGSALIRNQTAQRVERPFARVADASHRSEGGATFSVHPPIANESNPDMPEPGLPSTNDPNEGGSKDLSSAPLSSDIRFSRSRTFDLAYDLRHLSPGSAEKVDLWWTSDDGATWSIYASDDDCLSPMRVQVNREGLHGFRLVVRTRDGLSGAAPRAGDKPDFQVLTDWTRPTAEITSVEYGQGAQQGHLVVRWTASDANLNRTPVRLEYAQSVSGPWHPIAASLENVGLFTWRVDASVPEEVLLRIQAEDQVGNYATSSTKHPIRTAPLRPQVQILDVRPIDEAPGFQSAPPRTMQSASTK